MHAKFEIYSFNRSRDMEGSQNSIRDPFTSPFDVILHFFDNDPRSQSVCVYVRLPITNSYICFKTKVRKYRVSANNFYRAARNAEAV